jgi:hypothetical protein
MGTRFSSAAAPRKPELGGAVRRGLFMFSLTALAGVLISLFALIVLAGVLLTIGFEDSDSVTTEVLSETAEPLVQDEPELAIGIELPLEEEVRVPFVVSGWALDLSALESAGIDVVQIMDEGCEGVVIGIAELGLERSDIEDRYGWQFLYSGWQYEVTGLRKGDHTLAVRAKSPMADEYRQCQVVQLTVQ